MVYNQAAEAERRVAEVVERQQREKEALQEKINDLEKRFVAKQDLELEIEQLKGKANVMKHLVEEDDLELQNYVEEISEKEDVLNAVREQLDREMELLKSDPFRL